MDEKAMEANRMEGKKTGKDSVAPESSRPVWHILFRVKGRALLIIWGHSHHWRCDPGSTRHLSSEPWIYAHLITEMSDKRVQTWGESLEVARATLYLRGELRVTNTFIHADESSGSCSRTLGRVGRRAGTKQRACSCLNIPLLFSIFLRKCAR